MKKRIWPYLLAFAAVWLSLRLPWLDCDAGIPSMWEYGYNVTDEGYYLVGGKEKLLRGRFVDLPRAETATYGYALGMNAMSYVAHILFGLSDWKWRIPFVAVNFVAWMLLFVMLARRLRPPGAFLLCVAFSCVPMVVAYERTASNDVLIGSLLVMACVAALGSGRWRLVAPAFLVTPIMLVKPSMWALMPLVACCVLADRKTRSRAIDAAVFAGAFVVAFLAVRLFIYLVTKPEAIACGLSVSEVIARMNACYPLPNLLDLSSHFRGLSSFPRDPSCTMLGPLTLFLVPLPFLPFVRRIDWRTAFGVFIAAYVGAISIINTIYTHYFIPVLMMVPILWAQLADDDDSTIDRAEVKRFAGVVALVLSVLAVAWLFLASPVRVDRALGEFYSRIYNLPARNVWAMTAVPSILFALTVTGLAAIFGWRRLGGRGLSAVGVSSVLAGSVTFAILPAVRLAPALRVHDSTYLAPLMLTLVFGALIIVAWVAFPAIARKGWCLIPILMVAATYCASPTWRAAAGELLRPGTHLHRDAAAALAKVLPPDAIVLGERSDQLLMSLPVRTSSTILANSDGTVVAESILEKEPQAKLYLLADPQHAYNLQNFARHQDRFRLQPVAKVTVPSFANGRPVDVHLCRIHVLATK